MSYKPTVVVLGLTGGIGVHALNALLSPTFKSHYTLPIRAVTRDAAKAEATLSAKASVSLNDIKFYSANVESGEGLDKALEGADVVVNLLGPEVNHSKVVENVATFKSVKLYLPSEFGADIEETDYYLPLFKPKTDALELAKKLGLKTVSIITGVFFEYAFTVPPLVGVNFPNPGQIQYYGNFDVEISGTSVVDTGKVIASVVSKDPLTLPPKILINAQTMTPRLLANAYKTSTGTELEKVTLPLGDIKASAFKVIEEGSKSVDDFLIGLRSMFFDGKAYHQPTHNDFVSKGLFEFSSLQEVSDSILKK